jgi:hypothetical protein
MVTYQTEPRRISHQLIRGAFPIRAMNRAILPVLWRTPCPVCGFDTQGFHHSQRRFEGRYAILPAIWQSSLRAMLFAVMPAI